MWVAAFSAILVSSAASPLLSRELASADSGTAAAAVQLSPSDLHETPVRLRVVLKAHAKKKGDAAVEATTASREEVVASTRGTFAAECCWNSPPPRLDE